VNNLNKVRLYVPESKWIRLPFSFGGSIATSAFSGLWSPMRHRAVIFGAVENVEIWENDLEVFINEDEEWIDEYMDL